MTNPLEVANCVQPRERKKQLCVSLGRVFGIRVLILSISGLFLTANSDPDAAKPILDTANTPAPVAPKIDAIISSSAQIVVISD